MKHAVEMPHICDTPRRSEGEQRAFFEDVMARTVSADTRGRTGEYFLSIAGACIRLVFASDTLQRDFLPALSHLQIEAVPQPDAAIYVWDSDSTGIAMIPAPFRPDCFTDRGDIWGFDSPRIRSAFAWSDCSLSLMDAKTGQGTFWMQTGENVTSWTKAAPLIALFHWLMAQRGCHVVHAAAVGTEDGGVLISGKGGVGKSTTALACLAAGMKYVADDYLVVQLDPEPRAFRLYGTAKLEVSQLRHFSMMQSLLAKSNVPESEKAVLHLSHSDAYSITPSLPLVAALTPRFVSQRDTAVSPATPALLLHSAAFSTMSQLPHAGRATYEFIERLMSRLPCYELLLGRDIDRIPAALAAFLARPRDAADPTRGNIEQGERAYRPYISVVIPVYNGANFLREAVDNILAQNYSPLEIIVVDDGSTDDLKGIIRGLNVDVRLLGQRNFGPASARNLGIRNAVGEFLAFLDVDDLWPQDTLAILAAHLVKHPELDVVHGYGQLMRSDTAGGPPEFVGNARESFPYFISAALYRRRAFERTGLFDADLPFSEDTDWFTRAREKGLAIERLEQVTVRIRRHDDNMTKNKNLRELGTLRLIKKMLDRRRANDATRP
jgi:GT2 family glycosyltransferase